MNSAAKESALKIFIFIIATFALTSISYLTRDFAVSRLNETDFGFFSIDYVKNTGAAFSILQSHTKLLIVMSLSVLSLFFAFLIKNIGKLNFTTLLFYSILLAGVLGNLSERITDGYVTDYIRLNFITFPIFNLSDIFINAGAFLIICNILFNNEKNES